jgi:PPOX class probable F420-dependent enzyme
MDSATMSSLVRVNRDLQTAQILWLSTTRPDGRPHIVPTWFDWDGEWITLHTKPDAQKVRNMRHESNVMVALGRPDLDFAVELLEGEAMVVDTSTGTRDAADGHPSARFARKYRATLAEAGYTIASFGAEYPLVVRIRLTRLLDWGVRGARRREERSAVRLPTHVSSLAALGRRMWRAALVELRVGHG